MADESIKLNPIKPDAGAPAMVVNWDDSQMRMSYANVVNVSSTREEVAVYFGTNMTWKPAEKSQFDVRLNDRVVLSPYAAKRLWFLLGAVLKEYEGRFGSLPIDGGQSTPTRNQAGG